MKFSFASGDVSRAKADVLVLPVFENELTDKKKQPKSVAQVDRRFRGLLLKIAQQEGFKGGAEQSLTLHAHGKLSAPRLLVLGLGKRAKYSTEGLRMASGRAVKAANKLRAKSLVFALPPGLELAPAAQAVAEGMVLGGYRFDRYRTTNKEEQAAPRAERVQLQLPDGVKKERAFEQAVALGVRIAEATNFARNLVNEPAAEITPSRLAEEAERLAKEAGLQITVGGRKDIEKLKMGMFLGVARGSIEEPKLIHLRYVPANPADAKRAPIALIGKAITFDSGGLSLKTADGMVDMKTDMAGSAAVLGAMKVIASLRPPFPVHALMGACENMPSGNAYRPGDILVSRLGKTVEITNTDAEGRLVLGDVLAYASELKPELMVDLATLTGACMVALGHYIVGVFGDEDPAVHAVLEAARAAGEEMWRMPVTDLQKDTLRSDVADMKNSGERWGGAINAAVFLKEFVGETPWVHLDIAGPSQSPKDRGYYLKGATGVGVRTLVELVKRRAEQLTLQAHQGKAG